MARVNIRNIQIIFLQIGSDHLLVSKTASGKLTAKLRNRSQCYKSLIGKEMWSSTSWWSAGHWKPVAPAGVLELGDGWEQTARVSVRIIEKPGFQKVDVLELNVNILQHQGLAKQWFSKPSDEVCLQKIFICFFFFHLGQQLMFEQMKDDLFLCHGLTWCFASKWLYYVVFWPDPPG